MTTFFIGDTHFNHKNILEYEKESRPFKTVEEMNEELIRRWNSVVDNSDTVYHLGDFCFGRSNVSIAERLHGKKILILGNHDIYPITDYLKYFDRVFGVIFYKEFLLSHIPVHPGHTRVMYNIHGHLHGSKVQRTIGMEISINSVCDESRTVAIPYRQHDDPYYINVSCEQNNLTPISLEQIREQIND